MNDPRVGQIYIINDGFWNGRVQAEYFELMLVQDTRIGTDEEWKDQHIFYGITSKGKRVVDRVVYLGYYQKATPEQILLYWPEYVSLEHDN